jgi:hypothetical protein
MHGIPLDRVLAPASRHDSPSKPAPLTSQAFGLTLISGVTPMQFGRDAEAAKITSFLGELAGGSRVLLLEGEVGIGKTTLLREGHAAATRLGMPVLSAFPVESEIPLEFAGLTDLLEAVPGAMIDCLPVPQRQALRQAVFRTVNQPRAADPRTTATAVLTLLRELASRHPVLVPAAHTIGYTASMSAMTANAPPPPTARASRRPTVSPAAPRRARAGSPRTAAECERGSALRHNVHDKEV